MITYVNVFRFSSSFAHARFLACPHYIFSMKEVTCFIGVPCRGDNESF
jgi:hypothetical protein